MIVKDWNIEEMTGYKPKTTFYMDFSIADQFGAGPSKRLITALLKSWKDDYEYLTELVLALNWKIWEHYETVINEELAGLYNELWRLADAYARENLQGEELAYLPVTD